MPTRYTIPPACNSAPTAHDLWLLVASPYCAEAEAGHHEGPERAGGDRGGGRGAKEGRGQTEELRAASAGAEERHQPCLTLVDVVQVELGARPGSQTTLQLL